MTSQKPKITLISDTSIKWLQPELTQDDRMLLFVLSTKSEELLPNGFYKSNFQPSSHRPLFGLAPCFSEDFIKVLGKSMKSIGLNYEYIDKHVWKITYGKEPIIKRKHLEPGEIWFKVFISLRYDQDQHFIVVDCMDIYASLNDISLIKRNLSEELYKNGYKTLPIPLRSNL